MAQEQAVGELLVDDADVAGDDHGPLGAVPPDAAESVQHGLDAAADQGEDQDVVRLAVAFPRALHGAQELDGGHLAQQSASTPTSRSWRAVGVARPRRR